MTAPTPPLNPTPGTPPAEIEIDVALVRRLLVAQHPDLANLPLTMVGSGWDNAMYRLGQDLAVRLPRRQIAADLIPHEQRWLPLLAPSLPLAIPTPIRLGDPDETYPWAWSILPWLAGETADLTLPAPDQGPPLAAFFRALHHPAPADAPVNPYRGVALNLRQAVFEDRVQSLHGRTGLLTAGIREAWEKALSIPIDTPDTWLHGDPHPRNVLVQEGRISAFIDWGDMTSGDPAGDLASIWMLLPDRSARDAAVATYGASAATWTRARGWAVLYAVMLLDAGLSDDPRMALIAERTFDRLLSDASSYR